MTMLGLSSGVLVVHARLCFDCGPAVHEQSAGFLGHLTGSGAVTLLGSVALWLMLAEIVLATAGALAVLTHPSHRAVVPGRPANPNRE